MTLADLLRRPEDRTHAVAAVVLMMRRRDRTILAPDDEVVLRPGDELLLVGLRSAQRAVDLTTHDDATAEHVITGRRVPTGWIWRRLAGHD